MIVTPDAIRHKMLHLLFTRDTISNELADRESTDAIIVMRRNDILRICAKKVSKSGLLLGQSRPTKNSEANTP